MAMQSSTVMKWVKIGAAAVLLVVAAYLIVPQLTGGGSSSTSRVISDVKIIDKETGETWTEKLGRIQAALLKRPSPLDRSQGLPNPKTGKLTGFPESGWEELLKAIDEQRAGRASGE